MLFPQVMKFGGAALRDGASVRAAGELIAAAGRPAVVVSAHHGVTALLDRAAREAADGRLETDAIRVRHRALLAQLELDAERLDRLFGELFGVLAEVRERGALDAGTRDFVLSFGERMSARIVAAHLRRRGVEATPLDAFDLGLVSDSRHGGARPLPGTGEALRASLAEVPGVPVVTGFLARDADGRLTTLGPNGSDLSASLVAEAVGALELVFFKRVAGIMTADPARVPHARVIDELSFDEAAELAANGAEILHPAALEPAVRSGVRVRLVDFDAPERPGTTLARRAPGEGPRALAGQEPLHELIVPMPTGGGRAEALAQTFDVVRDAGAEPVIVSATGARIHVYASREDALARAAERLDGAVTRERTFTALTLVGRGDGLGARMLAVLHAEGIAPRHAIVQEHALSRTTLVDVTDGARALRAMHGALFEEREFVS